MLSVSRLKKQFGGRVLFEDVSLQFKDNCRYGVIGANGCGKSTFLKIIAGLEESTKGDVILDPKLKLGYLRQDHFTFDEYSIIDTVLQGNHEFWKVHHEREQLYQKESLSEEEGTRSADLEMMYADLDGYSAEATAGELLEGLGIPSADHPESMKNLVGGFKLRVLLAQVLFGKPDVLLLDEPTNHLDIQSIAWLEKFLNQYEGTILVISHDRHFLNAVSTHIADVDYQDIRIFTGNYDQYMEAIEMVIEQERQTRERVKKEIAKLQEFVSRFSANVARAKQATSRQKQIEQLKLEKVKPSSRKSPYIRFNPQRTLGEKVISIVGAAKSYEDLPVLKNVNLTISKTDRIAIIGPNGIGKTTLMKLIVREIEPDKGEVQYGETPEVSYFPQDPGEPFKGETPLLDWLYAQASKEVDEQEIRALLGRMLFSKEEAFKSLNVLSGGEKARAIISQMMLKKGNVLVLDEPTNHLDLESIESLNYALEIFDGPIVFVSHDRQFVQSLANRIIEIKDTKVIDYLGDFDSYLATKD